MTLNKLAQLASCPAALVRVFVSFFIHRNHHPSARAAPFLGGCFGQQCHYWIIPGAPEVGFEGPDYFSHVFKRVHGVAPSRFG
jgi:hypothetical protein